MAPKKGKSPAKAKASGSDDSSLLNAAVNALSAAGNRSAPGISETNMQRNIRRQAALDSAKRLPSSADTPEPGGPAPGEKSNADKYMENAAKCHTENLS